MSDNKKLVVIVVILAAAGFLVGYVNGLISAIVG